MSHPVASPSNVVKVPLYKKSPNVSLITTPMSSNPYQYSPSPSNSTTADPTLVPSPHYQEIYNQPLAPEYQTRPSHNPRIKIAHPYARLFAKKEEVKRRKIWNHALEKSLFSPYELSTLGAPHRRTIYISSLEAHIDRLHAQLLTIGFWPVAFEELEPFRGLNSKTAKSMVAGLQHDASIAKLKLLELERANDSLQSAVTTPEHSIY